MVFLLPVGDSAFGIALAFLVGIFSASVKWNFIVVCALALLCAVVAFVLKKHYLKEYGLFLLALVAGAAYFNFWIGWKAAHTNLPIGRSVAFSAVVSDEPSASEKYLIFSAAAEAPSRGTATVFAPAESDIRYGDLIALTGKTAAADFPGGDPLVFSPKITVTSRGHGWWLKTTLINFKEGMLREFKKVLPADEAALLGGITLGTTNGMGADLKNAMSASGTSYITGMYGYKIGALAAAVGGILVGRLSRRTVFIATTIILILFVIMSGGGASVLRAGIMVFFALAARESGRVFSMRNAITLTATAMVLVTPTILAYDAGFQLSFLSVIGIVYLGPALKAFVRYTNAGWLRWKDNALIATATLLAIMPVVMNTFGSFSATSFASNTLIMIGVPLTICFGMAIASTAAVSYYLAIPLAKLAAVVLSYQLFVIQLFAAWIVPLPHIFGTAWSIALYYVLLILFIRRYGKTEEEQRAVA